MIEQKKEVKSPQQISIEAGNIADAIKDDWAFFVAGIRGKLYNWARQIDQKEAQQKKEISAQKLTMEKR